jgi:DNA-binding phage protein
MDTTMPTSRSTANVASVTREALSRFLAKRGAPGVAVLVKAVQALRGAHYITLAENRSANEAFVYGWLNNRIG